MESLWPRLEPVLLKARKPARYVGGEANQVVKDWSAVDVHWLLIFPDVYEVGVTNQGLQILYEILNERDDALAERAYTPWTDMEEILREADIPLFSVDAHRPARAFDVMGFSLASELSATNVLTCLDLAGVPLVAAERGEDDPLVAAGGHVAFNPEPMSRFLDFVVLGEGEEPVGEITDVLREAKRRGLDREGKLRALAGVAGVYVPRFYAASYHEDGRLAGIGPREAGAPDRVTKRAVADLSAWPYPRHPLVPLTETVHERVAIEIFRGCTRACRFCQAGMTTRPVRERSRERVLEMVARALGATGFSEVGLLSLSSADHTQILTIAREVADACESGGISLSLPSTRVDAFSVQLAEEMSRSGRRSGLTLAPEAGSERLRRVINKTISEADLLGAVDAAFRRGWRQIKLYFMIGLPTETLDDVAAIADLTRRLVSAGRAVRRDVRLNLSVGCFVPKAHTPFQWARQDTPEELAAKQRLLREQLSRERAVALRMRPPEEVRVEGLLARGDRRVGEVILRAWRMGARFDGWGEQFSGERWARACAEAGVGFDEICHRERDRHEVLAWDHLSAGLDKEWMWREYRAAGSERVREDCRWSPCYDCGVCPALGLANLLADPGARPAVAGDPRIGMGQATALMETGGARDVE
ncbi:MAG: TIGR03960 family B12-binding radical SAM protein [Actinomycetota bacterium]